MEMKRTLMGKITIGLWIFQLIAVILFCAFSGGEISNSAVNDGMVGLAVIFITIILIVLAVPIVIPLIALIKNRKRFLAFFALFLVVIDIFLLVIIVMGSDSVYGNYSFNEELNINLMLSNAIVYLVIFICSKWGNSIYCKYFWIIVLICRIEYYISSIFSLEFESPLLCARFALYGLLTTATITLLTVWLCYDELFNIMENVSDFDEKKEYKSVENQLRELKKLENVGLISEEDYEKKKKQILGI